MMTITCMILVVRWSINLWTDRWVVFNSCCDLRKAKHIVLLMLIIVGALWTWWYGSWIYNYLCNQCLSPLTLWVRISLMRGVLDTTLCDEVCQWLAAGRWFSQGTPVSSTNKIEIFLSGVKHHNPNPLSLC